MRYRIIWAMVLLGSLAGCGLFEAAQTPEGQAYAKEAGRQAVNAVGQAVSGDWGTALTSAGAAVAAALGIVRIWRGGVNNRKGAAPTVSTP